MLAAFEVLFKMFDLARLISQSKRSCIHPFVMVMLMLRAMVMLMVMGVVMVMVMERIWS